VLTAGHCVTNDFNRVYSASTFTVQVGGITTSALKNFKVSKVTRNPKWNKSSLLGDLAILTLSTPVTTSSSVQPIKIFSGTNNERDVVRAFGWGQTSAGSAASTLQTASLNVGLTASCKVENTAYDGPNGVWTCTQLSLNGGNRAVCFGDSGGPL
ncbi:trypsin-like serine protease, partial [Ramicandelaber brevisporus]